MTNKHHYRVIVTRKLPDAVETRMMELFDTQLNPTDRAMTPNDLCAAIQDCDILVPTVTDRIDGALLAAAGPRLKMIASFGSGVDHIDLKAAQERQIIVTNTPGVLTEDTADVAMALILAVARRLQEGERLVRTHNWAGWTPTHMMGARLRNKRLGIIGMGRIGQALAIRARAFGLAIHYHNRRPIEEKTETMLEASYWQDLDQMLARMDIIAICCPLTPGTLHLLSAQRLALMPRHAFLINTARGGIVDEGALAQALKNGTLAGAGLDVYEQEPAIHPDLLLLENVVLLPHLGSATREGRQEMGDRVMINIKAFVDGHRAPDRVLPGLDG
jgi:glyoxylate reductase